MPFRWLWSEPQRLARQGIGLAVAVTRHPGPHHAHECRLKGSGGVNQVGKALNGCTRLLAQLLNHNAVVAEQVEAGRTLALCEPHGVYRGLEFRLVVAAGTRQGARVAVCLAIWCSGDVAQAHLAGVGMGSAVAMDDPGFARWGRAGCQFSAPCMRARCTINAADGGIY